MDLTGKISVKINSPNLVALCLKYKPTFDPSRFEIVAVRIFFGKEFILTIYAADKDSHASTLPAGKKPVKKFKIENADPSILPTLAEAFNFTVAAEGYDLEQMEMINK